MTYPHPHNKEIYYPFSYFSIIVVLPLCIIELSLGDPNNATPVLKYFRIPAWFQSFEFSPSRPSNIITSREFSCLIKVPRNSLYRKYYIDLSQCYDFESSHYCFAPSFLASLISSPWEPPVHTLIPRGAPIEVDVYPISLQCMGVLLPYPHDVHTSILSRSIIVAFLIVFSCFVSCIFSSPDVIMKSLKTKSIRVSHEVARLDGVSNTMGLDGTREINKPKNDLSGVDSLSHPWKS